MNKKLFWTLCFSISLVSVALVYLTSEVSLSIERKMSLISDEARQQMETYRQQADQLVMQGDSQAITQWLHQLQDTENTFASIIHLTSYELVSVMHPQNHTPDIDIRLGRNPEWQIHLHHDNPFIELPLSDGVNYLVFRLPDHMMPGRYWPMTHMILHLIVPLILMVAVSFLLYRHLMQPLQKLEKATRQFSAGDYQARVAPQLHGRNDELGRLASTFDEMASRVGSLVQTQRHLINDLSHELRTPIQRIELCLASEALQWEKNAASAQGDDDGISTSHQTPPALFERLHREAGLMRQLTEDTLTLAWLENEAPDLRHETVDLVGLLDAIADDTRFEFPDRTLQLDLPEDLDIPHSSEKALNMALENIIRNAMRHTPAGGQVTVSAIIEEYTCPGEEIDPGKEAGLEQGSSIESNLCCIRVQDQGPGVAPEYLEMIFKPFFRIDKARERNAGGFGLGLALARRQLEGVGGSVCAENIPLTPSESITTVSTDTATESADTATESADTATESGDTATETIRGGLCLCIRLPVT